MNLVLVAIHIDHSLRSVPLGTAMLAASVERAFGEQIATTLIDCTLQQSARDCTEQILSRHPDAVGLSMTVWNRDLALDIAQHLKASCPGIILFAGGPEATATPESLVQIKDLDFILTGEGEQKLVSALGDLLRGQTPNASALLAAESIADLGDLPSPYLTGLLRPARGGGVLWELSRGCPYRCDFCFESRGSAMVRRFPLQRVRAELQLFATLGVSEVFVLDPTFNYHKETAKELLGIMAEDGCGLHFSLEIRAELIDQELAELFASIDCSLQIGLQSADTAVLRSINRDFDQEEFTDKVLLLHQAGVSYGFDLIFGLPGDSLAGFLASLDFALSLIPNHLDIFPLAVLPGTRLADTAMELGLEYQPQAPYRVQSSTSFSAAEMSQAARIGAACDFFYNRGRAVPWFAMVLNGLELPPSEFFSRLAEVLPETLPDDPLPLQQCFVSDQFTQRRQPEVAALAADLIAYFSAVEPLLEGPAVETIPDSTAGELYLNPHSRIVHFSHDPQLLLQHLADDIIDLEELAFFVPRVDSDYFCYIFQNTLQLYPLNPAQSAYLRSLASSTPTVPPSPDFITEALAAGILFRNR
jgi:tRNA A37 methylthiotransferase MiaB